MENKQCYLCGCSDLIDRNCSLRDLPLPNAIKVLECRMCGLVFLSSFDHLDPMFWEKSKGFNQGGGLTSAEEVAKASSMDEDRRYMQYKELIVNKDILDFGCGAGNFLEKSKSRAKSCYGIDVDEQFKKRYDEIGIKVFSNIAECKQKFDVIFMFVVLPLLPDPLEILKQIKGKLKPDGILIVEVPNIDDALLTLYRSEAFSKFTYTSMSFFYFNLQTFSNLLIKAGYKINYVKNFQRYSLSNHLYWLSKNKPRGHQVWNFLDSGELNVAYTATLAALGKCDTLIGSFSL
jgi:SAM-dependent methyltransferase